MRRFPIVLATLALLAACAGDPLAGATPAQRLYAADGAYRALLELAVAYKDSCAVRPVGQQANCRPVVDALRSIDDRYALVRRAVDPASATVDDAAKVEALVTSMRTMLAGEVSP